MQSSEEARQKTVSLNGDEHHSTTSHERSSSEDGSYMAQESLWSPASAVEADDDASLRPLPPSVPPSPSPSRMPTHQSKSAIGSAIGGSLGTIALVAVVIIGFIICGLPFTVDWGVAVFVGFLGMSSKRIVEVLTDVSRR